MPVEESMSKKVMEMGKYVSAGYEAGLNEPAEPVDVIGILQQIHDEREAEEAAAMRQIMEERAAKFNAQNDDLIDMMNRARKTNLEAALNAAADRADEAFTEQVLSIFRNEPKQQEEAVPEQYTQIKQVPMTMAAKKAKAARRRRVNVYHVELGSVSDWMITVILLLALVARLAGVA